VSWTKMGDLAAKHCVGAACAIHMRMCFAASHVHTKFFTESIDML
jgi:hypothetical protein